MAFLANDPNQDPNQQNQQQGGAPAGQGVTIGGTGAGGTTLSGTGGGSIGGNPSSGAAGAAKSQTAPTNSGSTAPNLTAYVTANQGNDAAMGQSVNNTVGSAAQTADTAGKTYSTTVGNAIDQGTANEDPNLINTLNSWGNTTTPPPAPAPQPNVGSSFFGGKNANTGTPLISQKTSAPVGKLGGSVLNTTPAGAIDSGEFNKDYNASYGGPTGDQLKNGYGYGDANNAYNKVENYGHLAAGTATDGSGRPLSQDEQRGALLQDTYGTGGKQYTQGQRELDSFILGAGPQGQQALSNIGQQYGNYGSKLTDYVTGAQAAADQGVTTSNTTKQDTRNAAGTAFGNLGTAADTAAGKATSQNNTDTAAYKALASGDPAALKAAGYSDAAIKMMQAQKGFNYGKFADAGTNYDAGNYIDPGTAARYLGLAGLINGAGGQAAQKFSQADLTPARGSTGGENTQAVVDANALAGLQSTLTGRAADQTKARTQEAQNAEMILGGVPFGGSAGINGASAADIANARALGVDLSQFFKQGGAVNSSDVASAQDLAQLKQLSAFLDMTPQIAAPTASAGQAYTFDGAGLQAAIAKASAERAASRMPGNASVLPAGVSAPVASASQSGMTNSALPNLTEWLHSVGS